MRRSAPVAAAATLAAAAAALVPTAAHADTPWDVSNHSSSTSTATAPTGPGWSVTVVPTSSGSRTPDGIPAASPAPQQQQSSGYCWPVDCTTRTQQAAEAGAALGAAAVDSTTSSSPAAGRTTQRATVRRSHRAATTPRRHRPPHVSTLTSRWLVGPGDTLSLVASVWGVSVDSIATHNGIDDPNVILVGQVLHRPADGIR